MPAKQIPFEREFTIKIKGWSRGDFMPEFVQSALEAHVWALNNQFKGLKIEMGVKDGNAISELHKT